MNRSRAYMLYLTVIFAVQLFAMAVFPFVDTSEPRYAAIGRLMYESGDWITPWFAPEVPFWGKPPFPFWMQTISFSLFGVSEFSARLPSWIATVLSVCLIYRASNLHYGPSVASSATLIYASCSLVFIAGGAVLADPFLALGATLCMACPLISVKTASGWSRYGFFLGLIIGVLTKGPLLIVLAVFAVAVTMLLSRDALTLFKRLPWVTGSVFTLLFCAPWFALAELKTPGFLQYFILGEHIERFIVPGWTGDLYGNAHREPKGYIWYYWIIASLPWGLYGIALLAYSVTNRKVRSALGQTWRNPSIVYLVAWALITPVLFTFSSNILWTYLMPALPAFSILLALGIDYRRKCSGASLKWSGRLMYLSMLTPLIVSLAVVFSAYYPALLKTEKGLVQLYGRETSGSVPLYYLQDNPFSARFYSNERIRTIHDSELIQLMAHGEPFWVAVPKTSELPPTSNAKLVFENRRYQLYAFSM